MESNNKLPGRSSVIALSIHIHALICKVLFVIHPLVFLEPCRHALHHSLFCPQVVYALPSQHGSIRGLPGVVLNEQCARQTEIPTQCCDEITGACTNHNKTVLFRNVSRHSHNTVHCKCCRLPHCCRACCAFQARSLRTSLLQNSFRCNVCASSAKSSQEDQALRKKT